MPVIRMLPAFLGKIRAGSFRAEQNGFVLNIITGLGDPFCAQSPVYGTDGLTVAVDTTVGDIDGSAVGFLGVP
jgi:hypothetical protein